MNKLIRSLTLGLLFMFSFIVPSQASHLSGGEITWKCVMEGGVSKYKFTVVIYRKCRGCLGCLGNTSTLEAINLNGQFSAAKNGARITNGTTIALTRVKVISIAPSCSYPTTNPLICDPASSNNSDEGALEKHAYESGLIDFFGIGPPIDPNTPFIFVWTQNARDGAINLSNSARNGNMYLRSKMYPFYPNGTTAAKAVDQCFDNSPDFSEAPTGLLYASGVDFVFNNNAIDMDLDRLYYGFGEPLWEGPLESDPQATWENYPVFNAGNPFGLSQDQYSFNDQTGEFTFKPLRLGGYVSVIRVASYKCDQKVSEIFRDFQAVVLAPDVTQNSNRYPTVYQPFNSNTSNYMEVVAGNTIKFPIIIRDSLLGSNQGLSPQGIEFTLNGLGMGQGNYDTLQGCPFPPCAVVRVKDNYDYAPSVPAGNPLPIPISNTPGEIFGYGFQFAAGYNDTLWFYWPTTCANLDKNDDCNGLTSSLYNFVLSVKDDFCRVPAKTVRTFSINLLPPDFYLSPPVRCITYNEANGHVDLSWGESKGDTNTFRYYLVVRDNAPIDTIWQRRVFSYTDTKPGGSINSSYYIRAVNLCGINDEVSPVKPMKLAATLFRGNQARLQWNGIRTRNLQTAPYFKVFRSSDSPSLNNWVQIVDGDNDSTNTEAIDNYNLCGDTTYYRVQLYDSLGCISYSSVDSIVHPKLVALVRSDTVCFNTPTTFRLDTLYGGIPPYTTVRWIGDAGFSGGNVDSLVYTYPSPGMHYYTFTVIDSKGCRLDVVDSVKVRELPEFELKFDSVCPYTPIEMIATINSTTPIDRITWTGDNGYFNISGNPTTDPTLLKQYWTFGIYDSGRGKYDVEVTIRDIYGCETTIKDSIETGDPRVEILNDPNVCLDKKDSIRMMPIYVPKPFNTIQWFDKSTGFLLYQGEVFPVSVIAGRRNIDLEVIIEGRGGCEARGSKFFNLAPAFDLLADSVCVGDPINFHLDFANGSDTANFSYIWELDANTISTDRRPIHTYTTGGPKFITLQVKDNINQCVTFLEDTFIVRDPMQFSIGVDLVCAGDSTQLYANVVSGIDTAWEWTINEYPDVIPNNTIFITGNPRPKIFLPPGDGYYKIRLRMNDQNSGCWTTVDTIIKLFNQPDIDFEVDSINCAGNLTKFRSKVVGNTPPYEYEWSGQDGLSSTEPNPTHIYTGDATSYVVTLTVKNSFGCIVSKTKTVNVCNDLQTIARIPQMLNLGNKEHNTISAYTNNVDVFELKIFNRWGIEVFSTTDPKFTWDGKDKSGNVVMPGSYVYIINASGSGKRNLLVKGTISVFN